MRQLVITWMEERGGKREEDEGGVKMKKEREIGR